MTIHTLPEPITPLVTLNPYRMPRAKAVAWNERHTRWGNACLRAAEYAEAARQFNLARFWWAVAEEAEQAG